jgi:hypothetical protein
MIKPVRMQLSRAKGFNLQAASMATNGLPAINIARPGHLGKACGRSINPMSSVACSVFLNQMRCEKLK